jgi:23S rRNA (cytidine1920-2'-O)/16S rRNA (cytidine1409-2'-O)-methyltransferase
MKRLDLFLVDNGMARSRSQAREKIVRGHIQALCRESSTPVWKTLMKPSYMVPDKGPEIRETENSFDRFVSRAGLKLEGALESFGIDVTGYEVLDVGASTGGFTDCCLQRGAEQVFAIDVGHKQMAATLLQNPQVSLAEGINARNLTALQGALGKKKFDLIVMDVSFISIKLILPHLPIFLKTNGRIISLVKPQFELGPAALNKNGIVTSTDFAPQLERDISRALEGAGLSLIRFIRSSLAGADGNEEFFILSEPGVLLSSNFSKTK